MFLTFVKYHTMLLAVILCGFLAQASASPVPRENDVSTPSTNCQDCRIAARAFSIAFSLGFAQNEVGKLVSYFCDKLKIEDSAVCHGIYRDFKSEVLYVINEMVFNPDQLCPILVEDCGTPHFPYYTWDVPLPETVKPPVVVQEVPPPGSPTMKVLHISDLHIDYDYSAGSETDCKEPLCCNAADGPVTHPAGKWGMWANCDVPHDTVAALFKYISEHEELDYVYWTGDLPSHAVWNQSREGNLRKLDKLTQLFKTYFPRTPILSAVGNHESAPVDSYPQSIPSIPRSYRNYWLYDKLADQWTTFLPNPTLQEAKDIASMAGYVSKPRPGLRVISINRNYCDGNNFWAYLNQTDPDNTLHWLVAQLQAAEDAGDKVHIIGHEPWCDSKWKSNGDNYMKIVNRYESTIAAQFFGHTHKDEFKIYFDMSSPSKPRIMSSQLIGGSVTTYGGQNPSYRVYTVDARENGTWGVLDYASSYLDIGLSNEHPDEDPKIFKEYNAAETYGVPALFHRYLYQIYDKLKTNNTLVQLYNRYYYSSSAKGKGSCDDSCKNGYLRAIAGQLN